MKMKKKMMVMVCAFTMGMTMVSAGAPVFAEAQEAAAGEDAAAEQEEAAAEEKEEEVKYIGTHEEGDCEIQVTNCTGRNIKGMDIKLNDEETYETHLLEEGDVFGYDEVRIFCFKPEREEEEAADAADESAEEKEAAEEETEAAEEEKELPAKSYDILITFEDDGTTVEIHTFPFDDMEVGEIRAADGVGYLTYISLESKEPVDTKEVELKILEEKIKAAEEAAKAAAQAQQASTSSSNSGSNSYYEEPSYTEPSYEEPSYSYEEPSYEEPAYEEPSYEEPSYEEPSYEEPSYDGSEDGCVEDGLVY